MTTPTPSPALVPLTADLPPVVRVVQITFTPDYIEPNPDEVLDVQPVPVVVVAAA